MGSALLLSLVIAPGPASAASLPYCNRDLDSGVETCAATEAELLAKLGQAGGATAFATTTTYLLARLYEDANRSGAYYSFTASAPCDTSTDMDYEVANIGSVWNDRVTSFQGYQDCQIRVYEHASFGGLSYGAYTFTDNVGAAMNDLTTSFRLY
jgi:hypothetical protein